MDEQNLYVNHLASFDLSQNSRKHYLADKKQSSNCSQETEYVEIGADSKDKKIKQEGIAFRFNKKMCYAIANDAIAFLFSF